MESPQTPHSNEKGQAAPSQGTPLNRQQILDLVLDNIAINQERAEEIEEERFQKSLKVKPSRYVE